MHRNRRLHLILPLAALLASLAVTGCRNPGEEGQGQTHTAVPPNTRQPAQPPNTAAPPSADQVDPSSPRAVLDGTSTTHPATNPTATSPSSSSPTPH